ncbi:hypothetical protein [Bradyrhizobium liaoningense]|uniref:hypothetical protein n=1 Tax=Bradyrhizobium liaoningense TaxID=43992 RepID=UPI001BA49E78|nr:hypothetical protein [Bradyrhizobium liaoningense]MBR0818892.1 hypothetical protein [Bradyrhizobium liaoningense]
MATMREPRPNVAIHDIRDPFSLKPIPIIYYNAKFGFPPPPIDDGVLAQWRTRDYRAVTEFQLRTRGVQLDDAQQVGFAQGDWIAIIPAHDDEGRRGNPDQGTIVGTLRTALYGHCVRASRVLQMAQFRSQRDRNPHTRLDRRFRDRLKDPALAEVETIFREVSRLYKAPEVRDNRARDVTTDHFETEGRTDVKEWFGLTPTAIQSQAHAEILCYEQIYGPFSYDAVAERELHIISVLRRGHLRAITMRRIAREVARHQVAEGKPVSSGTKARMAFGKEFDLNLWGCFLLALYGSINSAALYTEFESLTDLFDLAAWFGCYARGDYEELPPEIAVTLDCCLSSSPCHAVSESDISDLEKIYEEIRYLAGLLVGEESLRGTAQQAIATRSPVQVAPLYYNIVITPSRAKPGHPAARIDARFKVGKGQEGINLSVDYENFPQMTKGENLSVRQFRPLLW